MNQNPDYHLHLFARQPKELEIFLASYTFENDRITVWHINEFGTDHYDVIINGIGIGNPKLLMQEPFAVFRLTEKFDNVVLDYLQKHPQALYIYLSSGAVYGSDFVTATEQHSTSTIRINSVTTNDYYRLSKLNAEVKHRAYTSFHIVDLRIFSFFSSFVDLTASYFMNDIINAIRRDEPLVTDANDMVRDYIHPSDLASIVQILISKRKLNDVFDVYSMNPVSKFEIITYFEKAYGLNYTINHQAQYSPTGTKNNYYSNYKKLADLGYNPTVTSLDTLIMMTDQILSQNKT